MLRRVPAAAWLCALIAVLNAAAWSIVVPPFQGRDEVDHFAYVAHLAETGSLPHKVPGPYTYSSQQQLVMEGLHYGEVRFTPYMASLSTAAQQSTLNEDVEARGSLANGPEAGGATSAPPLFYALQSIPYALAGPNVLLKLQLMRLLDALLGGITALLIFFFVRETVPATPAAGTLAAVCVALAPAFAFASSNLNPDALIYPLAAAVFLCLAVGFRRRLRIPVAVALGGAIAAGLLSYYSFTGAAAGALAALAVMAVRDVRRGGGSRALLAPGVAAGVGLSPAILYMLVNLASGSALLGAASKSSNALGVGALANEISYAWQLFLPRLPGMPGYFAGITTWQQIWFDRAVGMYGWMDTTFPAWVDTVALYAAAIVAVLCARTLIAGRAQIRRRLPEFAGYALVALGVLAMLGTASYTGDAVEHGPALGEPRYLLSLLPLFAAAIALAIRGAGRRWIPVVGAAMVLLFLTHDIFSQLQVIARYYG